MSQLPSFVLVQTVVNGGGSADLNKGLFSSFSCRVLTLQIYLFPETPLVTGSMQMGHKFLFLVLGMI